jgi:hypothetical protein
MRKILLVLTVLAIGLTANVAFGTSSKQSVPVTVKKHTTGTVYASANHAEGDDLYVSGDFKDSVLGRGAIVYVTTVTPDETGAILVKANRITIYTTKGSIRGKGQATQTFNPDGTSTVSDGTFALQKGTGDYQGDEFSGTFDGTYENGVYKFDYKGLLKIGPVACGKPAQRCRNSNP